MSFNHQAHRKLWHWLSLNPFKLKENWPEWEKNGGQYLDAGNECFACDACPDCSRCPLVWPNGHCYERIVDGKTLNGLFKHWYVLNGISRSQYNRGFFDLAWESIPELIQLARRIRDLTLAEYVIPSNDDDDDEEEDYLDVLDGFDEDAAYDRRVDDALCGDEDNIIIPWFGED